MEIKIVNKSNNFLPEYATLQSAGMDLYPAIPEAITLAPFQRRIIGTGLHIELPVGYEAQIRSRSGLAAKQGIAVLNSPGTIDADYRGEIKVILINNSNTVTTIAKGKAIAQMVVAKHERVEWNLAKGLNETERGEGGIGSTDKV